MGYEPLIFSFKKVNSSADIGDLNVNYIQKSISKIISSHILAVVKTPIKYFSTLTEVALGKVSFKYFLGYLWLTNIKSLKKCDLIYSHFFEAQTEIAYICSKFLNKNFYFKIHGSDAFSRINDPKLPFLVNKSNACLVVSEALKDCLSAIHTIDQSIIHVNFCGINTNNTKPPTATNQAAVIKLLYVGRLIENKGIQFLINCVHDMNKYHNFKSADLVTLYIVGNGPYLPELELLSDNKEYIYFCGEQFNKDVMKYYENADIFILPSLVEGRGTVLMEAMSFGLPIVSTCVGGIPEVVDHNITGLLVKAGSTIELSNAILLLLNDSPLREKLKNSAFEKSKSFNAQTKAEELVYIFGNS